VRLDQERSYAGALGFPGEFQIVEAPTVHVRSAVNVQVDNPFEIFRQAAHIIRGA
jgi:hypothetical protein